MRRAVYRAYRSVVQLLAVPLISEHFLSRAVGQAYGVGLREKLTLMKRIRRVIGHVVGGTGYDEHLLLASHLLSIPPSVPGIVVECGCFKGCSTASLSLVCELVDRPLVVFDSFEGLPEVAEDDRVHVSLHHRHYEVYKKGDYTGRLEEVRGHVRQYGCLDRCRFVQGYFQDTLPHLRDRVAFAFLDVDLHESLKTCLRHLWPLLHEQGCLFTHEATQLSFAAIFFNQDWWRTELGCDAPGLVGAGSGLPAGISRGTGLGYARKVPPGRAELESRFHAFCGDPTQSGVAAL